MVQQITPYSGELDPRSTSARVQVVTQLPPDPPPQPTQVQQDIKVLQPYTQGDRVDLVRLYQDVNTFASPNDPKAVSLRQAAARNFQVSDVAAAKYHALPIVPEKIYRKLTPEQQIMHRYTGSMSYENWMKLPVYMRGDISPEVSSNFHRTLIRCICA